MSFGRNALQKRLVDFVDAFDTRLGVMMKDWNAIKIEVENNGNIKTVTMEDLREAHGAGRLGVNIREAISDTLAGMGLGHIPVELPINQHELVRLYKRGTPIGDLILTVITPGGQNDLKLNARFAEGVNGNGVDYAVVVQQIRELIAE